MWSNQSGLTRSRPESRPMPKRRFDKLDPELRGRILKAAALEFGTHGYADASLNRIVEQAGISKGSMYYYFEDKEDLFSMVLQDLEERSADLGKLPIAAPDRRELLVERQRSLPGLAAHRGRKPVGAGLSAAVL